MGQGHSARSALSSPPFSAPPTQVLPLSSPRAHTHSHALARSLADPGRRRSGREAGGAAERSVRGPPGPYPTRPAPALLSQTFRPGIRHRARAALANQATGKRDRHLIDPAHRRVGTCFVARDLLSDFLKAAAKSWRLDAQSRLTPPENSQEGARATRPRRTRPCLRSG